MSQSRESITNPSVHEQQLWIKFQQGDENALSSIYSVYFDQLYNYGSRFTPNATLVEDCIQELFIKLIRNKANLAVPDSLKNYLFRALRSILFDHFERLNKFPSGELNEVVAFELETHAESKIISGEEQAARYEKLNAALQQLTPRQREAIFLKYQEGLSYPEIAEMLSLSQKAAYKLVGRAIQALRSMSVSIIVFSQIFNHYNA